MKYPFISLVLIACLAQPLIGQNEQNFFETAARVKAIAEKGLETSDPDLLLHAARILRKNPDIRPLFLQSQKSVYDPYFLLAEAESAAQSKKQREKIRKEKEKLQAVDRDYRPMNTLGGNIRVPGATEIFLESGQMEEITFRIVEQKELAIRFELGEKITIAVKDNSVNSERIIHKNIGNEKVKTINFTALPNHEYALVVRNEFDEPLDCNLAVLAK